MKKEIRETVQYNTVYVANDGTEFCTEEACKQYEATHTSAILGAFIETFGVKMHNGIPEVSLDADDAPVGYISDDEHYFAVRPNTAEELEILNSYLVSKHTSALGADVLGKVVVLDALGYDDLVYCYGTTDDLKKTFENTIRKLEAMCRKEEEK